ncbi:flagellar filament capping protein FliD [Paraperlucidibaca sp.]|jgi:flagellar hook-associated protein 2|uniref:flagellar filament capping protein FliD n=1 Tax=Paraperlucidibaca sp. TaxID=2708021 RepID=UPI0030F3D1B9|tara:strand:- start:118 stop:1536 length:1419 start_codon:yes stop_codon:yes gene_type:complete
MPTITSSGANGIDVNSLVSQLVAAERAAPAARISSNESKAQTKLSAFGSLQSSVDTFRQALDKLNNNETLNARSTSVGKPDQVAVTASTKAAAGSYRVSVESLAQTHQVASAGFAGTGAAVGEGKLTFSNDNASFAVTIDSSNNTLAGLRDAINSASGNTTVRASIVRADDGDHLVMTSLQSGVAGELSVTASDASGNPLPALPIGGLLPGDPATLASFSFSAGSSTNGATEKQAAQDAQIIVDGFSRSSSTNSFTDIVEGVSFTAIKADAGNPFTVSVTEDSSSGKKLVESFVAAYNMLQNSLRSLTSYNATSKQAGQLQGDATTLRLASVIRNELNTAVGGASENADTLSELGITTDAKTGALSIDNERLDALLVSQPDAMAKFFSGDDGFAARVDTALKGFADKDGLLAARSEGLRTQLKGLSVQRDALDFRMEGIEARYSKQFNALDTLLTSLNGTSSFLSAQLSSLL